MLQLLYIFHTLCTGENLGLPKYPPEILNKELAKGENLLVGANFASGGSGYYETTARLYVRPGFPCYNDFNIM